MITASAVVISPLAAVAEIDPEHHRLCIDAKDYKGCIEARTEQSSEVESNENEVKVSAPSTYNYEKDSVRQLKIRGKYGRYLTFIGRTPNTYSGTSGSYSPGSGGTLNCSTYGSSTYATTNCYRTGYVAPSYTPGRPGGTQHQRFRYELDCQDQTYNIKGDLKSAGGFKKGWMHVSNDPVASAVARKYCPVIDTLAVAGYGANLGVLRKDSKGEWSSHWGAEPDNIASKEVMDVNRSYLANNQFKKAIKEISKLVEEYPDDPRVWTNLCVAHIGLGNYREAIDSCNTALGLNSRFGIAFWWRGRSEMAIGLFDEAIKSFTKRIELAQDSNQLADGYAGRGRALYRKNEKKRGCKDMSKSIELGNKNPEWIKLVKKECKKYK